MPMWLERRLYTRWRDGELEEVLIRIGEPELRDDSIWWVPVRGLPQTTENSAICGEDSIQAMQLAIAFVDNLLTPTPERRFFWPPEDGEPELYVPLSAKPR